MTDHDLPAPQFGLWPMAPGVMVQVGLTAGERQTLAATNTSPAEDIRKHVSGGLMQMLNLDSVDPHCVHIVDNGLDGGTDIHHYTAAFHPDPTCPAEMRGGPLDGSQVDSSLLDHNERGIPRETLRPRDTEAAGEYGLAGFRSAPPVWVYDAKT